MPAREETYRNQNILNIVFAVSSILMFISIIWMIAEDHFREWKVVQSDFIRLDYKKSQRELEDARQLASKQELDELSRQLADAKKAAKQQETEAQATIDALLGKSQKADQELSFKKAKRDSIQSFYDIAVDRG